MQITGAPATDTTPCANDTATVEIETLQGKTAISASGAIQ